VHILKQTHTHTHINIYLHSHITPAVSCNTVSLQLSKAVAVILSHLTVQKANTTKHKYTHICTHIYF